ncbi:hypothetical protein Anas_14653 [Armadillidium nasatum]|uniref:Uncharacterized protein n=1 Tax=Armadillidium nasatum TaxID=96803 RepID=A0A5N5T4F6_9CRUS|nr:hypothetical protein Anas_14653 [Armadillidium nasatum]
MENLSYEESVLDNCFAELWLNSHHKVNANHGFLPDNNEQPFSWEGFIDDQKYSVLPQKLFEREDIIEDTFFSGDEEYQRLRAKALREDDVEEEFELNDEFIEKSGKVCVVDGAAINDIPTRYDIKGLLSHELPVKGTFIHPKIIPGFCYVVRPLDSCKPLFNGKGLCLEKIGLGYGKRLTFAGKSQHENENYFWSDTNPEGYGFALEVVHIGDKFTMMDETNEPIGTVEVEDLVDCQNEVVDHSSENKLEKQVMVSVECKVKYFDDSFITDETVIFSGVAVAIKRKNSRAKANVIKVKDCLINGQKITLVPSSIKDIQKSQSLSGETVSDIPTNYSISGLHRNELPVIGTFVDPRITPGFKYRVRLLDSKKHLFEGEAQTLLSVGKGYGKRITFAGKSLKENENYFWSDTHPQGFGFTLEAVCEGDKFKVVDNNGYEIGQSRVFKLCGQQMELSSEVRNGTNVKRVRVSVACHILLNGEVDGITTRVNGKNPKGHN